MSRWHRDWHRRKSRERTIAAGGPVAVRALRRGRGVEAERAVLLRRVPEGGERGWGAAAVLC